MKNAQFFKKRLIKKEENPNIDSSLINYRWINQKNNIFRSLPPEFIIKYVLKLDYPDFDTLRNWIKDEKSDIMGQSLEKTDKKKLKKKIYTKRIKGEEMSRYIGDFSPTVEFKSDQFKHPIKLSRHIFLKKLRNDVSTKFDQMFGSAIQLNGGLYRISLNLSLALNELMHNIEVKDYKDINVISFLSLYNIKKNINSHEQDYGIIRGLMQDITFIESNLNRLRGGLNVYHLMTILGWESAFKLEGLCLFFEILTNNLVIGMKSFVERLFRFTHNFSTNSTKKILADEFEEKHLSKDWLTPLEELYSIVELIDLNYNLENIKKKFPSINLNFDYGNGETLILLNKLRNTYIHSSPGSISGVEKEELVYQKPSEIQSYTIYNIYIAFTQLIENVRSGGFSEFLNSIGVDSSSLDLNNPSTQEILIKQRIKWRSPTILRDKLDTITSPGLYEEFPTKSIIGVELPEINKFHLYPRKIIRRKTEAIKDIAHQNIKKVSLFNLSDAIDSLFSFSKNLLKVYIIKEIELAN